MGKSTISMAILQLSQLDTSPKLEGSEIIKPFMGWSSDLVSTGGPSLMVNILLIYG